MALVATIKTGSQYIRKQFHPLMQEPTIGNGIAPDLDVRGEYERIKAEEEKRTGAKS